MKYSKILGAITLSSILMFSGCGSSEDSSLTTNQPGVTQKSLAPKAVTKLKLLDVNGEPLQNAELAISPASTTPQAVTASIANIAKMPAKAVTFQVDNNGFVTIDGLEDGTYLITITLGDISVSTTIIIGKTNYQEAASVVAPVSVDDNGSVTKIENAIIASVSGIVIDENNNPIPGAVVQISGGAATNGAFASAITDENGIYMLTINTSADLADALKSSTLIASASGYATVEKTNFGIEDKQNLSGVNFTLSSTQNNTSSILYQENFDTTGDNWTVNKLSGTNENNTWHLHTKSITGQNKAYVQNLVKLAPNDDSNGTIPAPIGERCFWYGNGTPGDETFGNFIGSQEEGDSNLSGGTSTSDNSAELISPPIDLTGASGDIKLSFDTYWEIESVNPNQNGFDLMIVSVSDDNGTTWRDLAKLNPLNDPQTDIDRSPVPFSNTGYNSAPAWLTQEAIPLVDLEKQPLSGKVIRLKFTFRTVDGLYNGFRGWMIDNVKISTGKGTFPLIEDVEEYIQSKEYNTSEQYMAPALPHRR